jgi:hypothetical protein
MTANESLPLKVCIAMGILMAQLGAPGTPWAGRIMTFTSQVRSSLTSLSFSRSIITCLRPLQPAWVDISTAVTLREAVDRVKEAPWGMSTDFGAAMRRHVSLSYF